MCHHTRKRALLSLLLCVVLWHLPVLTFAKSADTPAKRVTVGGKEMAQRLVSKVAPVYPDEARRGHIEGTVKLSALIATDGSIKQLSVVEGHPLLTKAALDAVRQWKYQPIIIDGSPVEVVTAVFVVFQLKN